MLSIFVVFSRMNWDSFRFIDLFAGIGGIRLGFEALGGKCVFSSEFDEDACKTYEANFGEYPSGDITKIEACDIPDFEILLAGFPCQAFSIIGKKEGFDNETCGTLFFEIERILAYKRPRAFMLENVRNLVSHDKGNTFRIIRSHLEALGYNVYAKVLNALDFGVPQKRERIIIVGFIDDVLFTFPEPVPLAERQSLSDVLERDVDEKYYVKDRIRESRLMRLKDPHYPRPYISHENMAGSITPHHYSSCLRAGASANYILINDERRPTEREMLRLQGFPEDFKVVVPYGKLKHQTGNSVAVPVIKAVASRMIQALKNYDKSDNVLMEKDVLLAKEALDNIIRKPRVHLYKPIQIGEILYHARVHGDVDLDDLESYRNASKHWRDMVTQVLLGRTCNSSARFQDDLFNENAVPPRIIKILAEENNRTGGAVEAYIYSRFTNKHTQLASALARLNLTTKENFDVKSFIDGFWNEPGLKRSLDKVYEIVVYALFSTLVEALRLKVEVSVDASRIDILREFGDFAEKIMCLNIETPVHSHAARVYRVGVTNAADRGLDMYSNWGPAIQIKHLSLDEELAESIVTSIASDRIVIVCKDAEKGVILSLLTQIGWKSRIQSIVTERDLIEWYDMALRGRYADSLGDILLEKMRSEMSREFPSLDDVPDIIKSRGYDDIDMTGWTPA